jgi:hypothetical protein
VVEHRTASIAFDAVVVPPLTGPASIDGLVKCLPLLSPALKIVELAGSTISEQTSISWEQGPVRMAMPFSR